MRGLSGRVLLALASLVLALAVLEVAFRLLDLRGVHVDRTRDWAHALLPEEERIPGISVQFRPNSRFRLDYDSNPRGTFDERNGLSYSINAHGFRGPDFEWAKAPGRFRVLVLGDSFAFGEGVRFEDTFASGLQRRLAEAGRDDVEVLNLGVSGWASVHEMIFLEEVGLSLRPDLVLVAYVLNDAQYRSRVNLWEGFRAAYAPPGALRHSYLASYVYARIGRHVLGRRYVEETVNGARGERRQLEATLSLLGKGRQRAAAAGARFAVAIFPFLYRLDASYPFAELHRAVREGCERRGIPVLDLFPAFEGREYATLWVHPSDQHPNEEAHGIAAEAMADFLRRRGLVNGK